MSVLHRLAAASLKRLVQIRPRHVSAWINLAVAQFSRERYADGIEACHRALAVEPANLLAIFNLALAHEHLGRYTEASNWVRRGLAREPQDLSLQRLELRLRVLKVRAKVVRGLKKLVGKK